MTEKRFTLMWIPESTFSRFWIARDNGEKMNAINVVDMLNRQDETIQQLKQENMELTLKCKPLFSKRQLHEENQILKQLIKRVLETTPVEHSLALDLKNSVRELYE